MAHKKWCKECCSECIKECHIDMEIPCSPDCTNMAFDKGNDYMFTKGCLDCDILMDEIGYQLFGIIDEDDVTDDQIESVLQEIENRNTDTFTEYTIYKIAMDLFA